MERGRGRGGRRFGGGGGEAGAAASAAAPATAAPLLLLFSAFFPPPRCGRARGGCQATLAGLKKPTRIPRRTGREEEEGGGEEAGQIAASAPPLSLPSLHSAPSIVAASACSASSCACSAVGGRAGFGAWPFLGLPFGLEAEPPAGSGRIQGGSEAGKPVDGS